jgi:hypothetical protein
VSGEPGIDEPFPGFRPFRRDESHLFFGREEQCDELLDRLRGRRLVAVVGASGNGKSSLVEAGLIPWLRRGYLPEAGSAWCIARCQPGTDPFTNLAVALSESQPAGQHRYSSAQFTETLTHSSLGLSKAVRLLTDAHGGRVLLLVDQFEEIFRFQRSGGAASAEAATAFVRLLTTIAGDDDTPAYVVLTMRSEYLGDCTQFADLPETLNECQYLVPDMGRQQLQEAIEGPISVANNVKPAHVEPRLVQRLLHDVQRFRTSADVHMSHDSLPLLQHTLMRLWNVSAGDRERGEWIDLKHYEHPSVGTLTNALDRHAEEAFRTTCGGNASAARVIATAFQRLSERDPQGRDVRRPTSLTELTQVALRLAGSPSQGELRQVRKLLEPFAGPGCSFLRHPDAPREIDGAIDGRETFDVSHESLLRTWRRLRAWIDEEATSRSRLLRLAEVAATSPEDRRNVLTGRQLREAKDWFKSWRPTAAWAQRYTQAFPLVEELVTRSSRAQTWNRVGVAAALASVLAAAAWVWSDRVQIRILTSQLTTQTSQIKALEAQIAQANRNITEANHQVDEANAALTVAQRRQDNVAPTASSEVKEVAAQAVALAKAQVALEDARRQVAVLEKEKAELRVELASKSAQTPPLVTPTETALKAENERLKKDNSQLQKDSSQLKDDKASLEAKLAVASKSPPGAPTPSAPSPIAPPPGLSAKTATAEYESEFGAGLTELNKKRFDEMERHFARAVQLAPYATPRPTLTFGADDAVPNAPHYYLSIALANQKGNKGALCLVALPAARKELTLAPSLAPRPTVDELARSCQ